MTSQGTVADIDFDNVLRIADIVKPREGKQMSFQYLMSYFTSSVAVENLEDVQHLLQEHELFEAHPNFHIVTKQGHLITRHWLEIRGKGDTTSLEQRAAYDRAINDAEQIMKKLKTAQLAAQEAIRNHEDLNQVRQQYDPAIQQLQTQVTLRERIKLQSRAIEQQRMAQKRAQQQEKLAKDLKKLASPTNKRPNSSMHFRRQRLWPKQPLVEQKTPLKPNNRRNGTLPRLVQMRLKPA